MKIAIPAEEKTVNCPVCQSFGRTPFYVFYNTENGETEYFINEAANNAGGAGIRASQSVVDSKAEAIITYRLGQNSANVLNAAGIKMYKAEEGTVNDNIELFKQGKLSLLSDIHPGFHNHG